MNPIEKRLTALERVMMPAPVLRVEKIGNSERWYYGSKLVKHLKGISYGDL